MACIATRLMSSGAGKSGKPCERLTAPYFIASRVISRITDSVNRLALRETRREIEGAGVVIKVSRGLTRIQTDQNINCLSQERDYFICSYLCLSVFIRGFVRRLFSQLVKDRAHGRRQRTIRRQPQIVFISDDRFFVLSAFFVSRAQQLIDDRLSIRELIDRDLIFARGQLVLAAVFIDAAQADVRFWLEAVAFPDGAIERTNRFLGLPGLAIDASFGGGRLGIDGLVTSRTFDLSQGAV